MFSLSALRYTEATMRLGSFSAAAREHGVSQPTVSAAVSALEEQLGCSLLVRGGRQLSPTRAGERFLPRITAVLRAHDDLAAEATGHAAQVRSELRVGYTPLVGAARLGHLIDPFRHQRPNSHFVFFESSVVDLEERLRTGNLDVIVGCGFKLSSRYRRLRLLEDALVVCSTAHSVTGSTGVGLEVVCTGRLLLTEDLCGLASATRRLIRDRGLEPETYPGKAMSYGGLEDWVELGLGQAVMPSFHVRNRTLARLLVDRDGSLLTLPIEAAWSRSLATSEHAAQFLAFLHQVEAKLGAVSKHKSAGGGVCG